MKTRFILVPLLLALGAAGCSDPSRQSNETMAGDSRNWDQILQSQINLLGHRNWIVVVDAAYPLQSSPGICTILSDKDHLATIEHVLNVIGEQAHIRPVVYMDKEIDYLDESAAPGINDFRSSLSTLMGSDPARKLLHEDIIRLLSEASEQFSILIIKTDFILPYTSLFFQLDCKYWDEKSERDLRKQMEADQ